MKRLLVVLMLLTCTVTFFSGCTTTGQQTAPAYTDQEITDEILNRLGDDTLVRDVPFSVQVRNGVVIMRGMVNADSIRARALGIAQGTPGVVAVYDQIDLR